jgi:signal transduction histidine kinase
MRAAAAPTAGQENTGSMFLARQSRLRRFVVQRRGLLVAFALTILVVASLVENAILNHQPLVLLLMIPSAAASILLRRNRTGAALVLAVAVDAAVPNERFLVLPVMAVLYTIATRTAWRRAAATGAGAAIAAIIAGAAWGGRSGVTDHNGLLGYAIGIVAFYAAAVAIGLYIAAQRRVLEGLHERAERLERERKLLADRAVEQERIRMAQEIHDIVAHNVSLMVVKAQALGATIHDDRVAESTDVIAELGRRAMTEMHTTLRLLRGDSDTPDLAPQPGLAQLERLVEQSRGAGIEIELTVEGQPRQLAQGIDLSAFRIVQEALTNVVKHAAGARTKVTLAYQPQGIELTVIDTEDQVRASMMREPSDGHGVIGMRERAALFGGTLRTEATPGGFKVTATLPYEPTASR